MSIKLPKYVTIRKRKKGQRYYFQVPSHARPEKWPKAIRLNDDPVQMIPQAENLYKRLTSERGGAPLVSHNKGTIPWLLAGYHKTDRYRNLSKNTQKLYDYCAAPIKTWSKDNGNPHVKNIKRPHIFKFLKAFDKNPTKRKKIYVFLRVLLQYAVDMGEIDVNPALALRLTEPEAKVHIWTDVELHGMLAAAEALNLPSVAVAIVVAHETGQRQGDVLSMEHEKHYKDGKFSFAQSKTGQIMQIKATPLVLELLKGSSGIIVAQLNGRRFIRANFTKLYNRVRKAAGMTHLRFMHLRHTAVVSLARASCTPSEIAAITGHTLGSVNSILARYLPRDSVVADNAIDKREIHREIVRTMKETLENIDSNKS